LKPRFSVNEKRGDAKRVGTQPQKKKKKKERHSSRSAHAGLGEAN